MLKKQLDIGSWKTGNVLYPLTSESSIWYISGIGRRQHLKNVCSAVSVLQEAETAKSGGVAKVLTMEWDLT